MSKLRFVFVGTLGAILIGGACSPAGQDFEQAEQGDSDDSLLTEHGRIRFDLQELLDREYAERLAAKPHSDVRGEVLDTEGNPLQDVSVRIAGKVAKTDARGGFVVPAVPYGTFVVSFEHEEYVFNQQIMTNKLDNTPTLFGRMRARAPSRTFNADVVSEIHEGSLSLKFEPGDLVLRDTGKPVHGNVDIRATTIEPGKPGHMAASPAPLAGVDTNGKVTALFSAGMLEVELSQKGRHVQVRPGATVDIEMKVPEGVNLGDAQSIPMWHHDTEHGIWIQEPGLSASFKTSDKGRVATVALPHFSAWNLDMANPSICTYIFLPGAESIRTVSVSAADGVEDEIWTMTGECQGGMCVVNAPSKWAGGNVAFKYKVYVASGSSAVASQWCDLELNFNPNIVVNPPTTVTMNGFQLGDYAAIVGATYNASSFCGTWGAVTGSPGGGGYWTMVLQGAYDAAMNTENAVVLTPAYKTDGSALAETLKCLSDPPSLVAPDPGLVSMSMNAKDPNKFQDVDRDSAPDIIDACPGRSNANACKASCYVPPVSPDLPAPLTDKDRDTVHNFCDNKMSIYNPSQYNGL
ncbi:carboxypeptidase-like regulatory domain-containing protein [Polyangium fumosum]|uniref:Carboxypeptidase regulatory-like domain-containing protein n=1 Tax=Polyangium fumosum TaxID=889272 RepID=A0A4U1IMJ5_9BACT|nr:carboxypeptidase-like regulatory domain-containing protein [Polyangium fumosum]TKC95260.1 carboxypeptidase regulatory-like domain-containing protein [Polyangium fumosum]